MEKDMKTYGLLADILEYPTSRIAEQTKVCENALEPMNGQAFKHLRTFGEYCVKNPLSHLEELYTDTFDLEAICCPYVGFHLFGEDRSRGMFMVKLKEYYRAHNYFLKTELPDHISIMLRSLSVVIADDEARDLIKYCLIPTVKKMILLFKDSGNPYKCVLQAVLTFLEAERERPILR